MAARAMTGRALAIGITIGLRQADESLFVNGIKQNALFLAKCFQNSPARHTVRLLNTTGVAVDGVPWDRTIFPTEPFESGWRGLDVVIELGGQLSAAQTAALKAQKTRLVSYCCGPEYVQNIEAMLFGRPLWDHLFINLEFDELWVIPQVAETTLPFLQTLRRCPARIVPFVWDPFVLDQASEALPSGGEYRPRFGPRRISIIEPNIDVLKFCLYPILAVERAFRQSPQSIDYLHVANSINMVHADREFAGLMRQLDIVKAGKASFIGHVETPWFLANYTDVVVSNQWGLPLNYFYLECAWQGFPLVHNAHLVDELGYYYPGNDVGAAARQLLTAFEDHDADWVGYRDRQRGLIDRFLATNPALVRAYDGLLSGLVGEPGVLHAQAVQA